MNKIITLLMMITMATSANAWVGGQLSIESPKEKEVISGKYTMETFITGNQRVTGAEIYGKAMDTSTKEFKLIGSSSCFQWNSESQCNVEVDTTILEDSSLWQIYAKTANSSDPSDIVQSVTLPNIKINNTIPSLQYPSFITPNQNEIIRSSEANFGALVNSRTTTSCLITFTSIQNPGKKIYSTDYESGEYCNATLKDVADGIYTFTISASDGMDVSPSSSPQKFTVDTRLNQKQTEKVIVSEKSSNWFLDNWFWVAGIIILFLYFGRKRR